MKWIQLDDEFNKDDFVAGYYFLYSPNQKSFLHTLLSLQEVILDQNNAIIFTKMIALSGSDVKVDRDENTKLLSKYTFNFKVEQLYGPCLFDAEESLKTINSLENIRTYIDNYIATKGDVESIRSIISLIDELKDKDNEIFSFLEVLVKMFCFQDIKFPFPGFEKSPFASNWSNLKDLYEKKKNITKVCFATFLTDDSGGSFNYINTSNNRGELNCCLSEFINSNKENKIIICHGSSNGPFVEVLVDCDNPKIDSVSLNEIFKKFNEKKPKLFIIIACNSNDFTPSSHQIGENVILFTGGIDPQDAGISYHMLTKSLEYYDSNDHIFNLTKEILYGFTKVSEQFKFI